MYILGEIKWLEESFHRNAILTPDLSGAGKNTTQQIFRASVWIEITFNET